LDLSRRCMIAKFYLTSKKPKITGSNVDNGHAGPTGSYRLRSSAEISDPGLAVKARLLCDLPHPHSTASIEIITSRWQRKGWRARSNRGRIRDHARWPPSPAPSPALGARDIPHCQHGAQIEVVDNAAIESHGPHLQQDAPAHPDLETALGMVQQAWPYYPLMAEPKKILGSPVASIREHLAWRFVTVPL
jgi:hypothetical protein